MDTEPQGLVNTLQDLQYAPYFQEDIEAFDFIQNEVKSIFLLGRETLGLPCSSARNPPLLVDGIILSSFCSSGISS